MRSSRRPPATGVSIRWPRSSAPCFESPASRFSTCRAFHSRRPSTSRSSWPRRSGAPTPASSSTASSGGSPLMPRSATIRLRRAKEMAEIDQMDYETAVAELERTVQLLGKEQDDLAESVRTFERGLALARRCAQLLDDAERRLKEVAAAGGRPPGPGRFFKTRTLSSPLSPWGSPRVARGSSVSYCATASACGEQRTRG